MQCCNRLPLGYLPEQAAAAGGTAGESGTATCALLDCSQHLEPPNPDAKCVQMQNVTYGTHSRWKVLWRVYLLQHALVLGAPLGTVFEHPLVVRAQLEEGL
eukprot:389321-Prorocentrum_minimum.AAC.2